ncbi:mitochondrial chaperone bcs1 [Trichoderma arundinaceum]|uniref:Mitochondrial chaperone bcs1 n=1 Tax=Trichoderma arundinaceum TaxID=490622 RepID=A0A395NEI1_TRIAR|nr:mitochondrial chaperone bcs1 [Trichoderma arundinaceum]
MKSRRALVEVADETQQVLPSILQNLLSLEPAKYERLEYEILPALQAASCPRRTPSGKATIRVVQEDSLNAAIELANTHGSESGRVVVLSNANPTIPGGPWLMGVLAQEEEICYRSSLSLSLHKDLYPWTETQGIYSPDVVIIRDDHSSGHNLLIPDIEPKNLPIVSVISLAAPTNVKIDSEKMVLTDGVQSVTVERAVYGRQEDRNTMKMKMRLCLRTAASHGHGLLVLGAFGCGAFGNPKDDVATCWLEVLREEEFQGGWWEEIWFAVFDPRGEGNFEVFEVVLHGAQV